MYITTAIAPVNIAVIKYWGKRDESLILPFNDSLSMTLSTDQLCTTTTVASDESFTRHRLWLNGVEVSIESNPRVLICINELQQLRDRSNKSPSFPTTWKLHIASNNNFPTSAGLASSASGFAALVFTIAKLYGIKDEDLTIISRQGSGSACRSLHGGFVRWYMGSSYDGSDSFARQIAPASYWPDMHVLIVVINDNRKEVSSTEGMRRTVGTSTLFDYRIKYSVPERIELIMETIRLKDFEAFAEVMMQESNQFHAVAMDAFPPCVYMNDVSHSIVDFVHTYNNACGGPRVAYTFDAGPNACLYVLKKDIPGVIRALLSAFPSDDYNNFFRGIPIDISGSCESEPKNLTFPENKKKRNVIKYILHTRIGDGPSECKQCDILLDPVSGLPRY